jgi:hypothetical protein
MVGEENSCFIDFKVLRFLPRFTVGYMSGTNSPKCEAETIIKYGSSLQCCAAALRIRGERERILRGTGKFFRKHMKLQTSEK